MRAAGSWCSATSTTGSWSCSSPPSRAWWSATRRRRDTEMGPLVSRPHCDSVAVLRARRRARSPSAARRPSGPGILVPADGAARRSAPTARVTEEIFGPVVSGAAVRRRGRRDRAGQRHRVRPVRVDLDRQPVAARSGCRAPWRAGNLSVNSHSSVRYSTPFGGFKQSGLGRELGPDAPEHFTETKNVFFAMGEV